VQAAAARASVAARTRDPCRISRDRVVVVFSEASPTGVEEKIGTGDDADIFISMSGLGIKHDDKRAGTKIPYLLHSVLRRIHEWPEATLPI
jgi:hypothetical protein